MWFELIKVGIAVFLLFYGMVSFIFELEKEIHDRLKQNLSANYSLPTPPNK